LEHIPNDDGTDTRIPQCWAHGFAAYQSTGYLYGGSRTPDTWNFVSDYLYKVDLETGNVLRVSGSKTFNNIPVNLPAKGIPGSSAPPPKDSPALWFAKNEESLYAFGGYSNYKRCFGNDFWKYNISSNQWTWIDGDLSCDLEKLSAKYGMRKVFSPSNYPGARWSPAYWENNDQNKLYFFSGMGAYYGSVNKTDYSWFVGNCYFDGGGDDVWVYDLAIKQWAWIAGSSIPSNTAISTAPGTEIQTPWGDTMFGKSWDSDLLVLGSGSSGTF
jgi:hypothetical protein